jgi:hypothetical protein
MGQQAKRAFVAATVLFGAAAATLGGEGVARAQSVGSQIVEGQALYPGQWLTSPNGEYRVGLQGDGNLVLSDMALSPPVAFWATGTDGYAPKAAYVQNDGNFVLYNVASRPIWASNTVGWAGVVVSAGDDGALHIDGGYPYWGTGAVSHLSPPSPRPPAHASALNEGGELLAGQYLQSPSGEFILAMQLDGNLVLTQNGRPLWSTGTGNRIVRGASVLDLPVPNSFARHRGSLVLTDYLGAIVWSSGADYGPAVDAHGWSSSGARLQVQDDGNLVLYANVEERFTRLPVVH